MFVKVYYDDLRDCWYLERNLLDAVINRKVVVNEQCKRFMIVEGTYDELTNLYKKDLDRLVMRAYTEGGGKNND